MSKMRKGISSAAWASGRSAHPATAAQAQAKAPHPATAAQAKAPHPATAAQAKAPHPATAAQAKALGPAGAANQRLPSPTAAQRRGVAQAMQQESDAGPAGPACLPQESDERTMWDRIIRPALADNNQEFASSGLAFGFGRELAYLAQMIRSDLSYIVYGQHYREKINTGLVVAAAYCDDTARQRRTLVVGINCNEQYTHEVRSALRERLDALIMFAKAELSCGFLFLFDQGYSYNGRPRSVGVSPVMLHAEQKVIGYIQEVNFQEEKLIPVVQEIGIAHVQGPCSKGTAGEGSQDCREYLEQVNWVGVWLQNPHFAENAGLPSSIWQYLEERQ